MHRKGTSNQRTASPTYEPASEVINKLVVGVCTTLLYDLPTDGSQLRVKAGGTRGLKHRSKGIRAVAGSAMAYERIQGATERSPARVQTALQG